MKKSLAIILFLQFCLFLLVGCSGSSEIIWTEPFIEQGVRDALDKPEGIITSEDLDGITELYIYGEAYFDTETSITAWAVGENEFKCDNETYEIGNISNLEDIKYFKNLTILELNFNAINDLSPLENLTNFKLIDLSNNFIENISPLENMLYLEDLNISVNNINDISPLEGLINLKHLGFASNQVSDISSLKNLVNLEYLNFVKNFISDITSLNKMTKLEELSLGFNQISDISVLKGMTKLSSIYAPFNQISDIDALKNMSTISTLHLNDNLIRDISALENINILNVLNLSNNLINDTSLLGDFNDSTAVFLEGNPISEEQSESNVDSIPLEEETKANCLLYEDEKVRIYFVELINKGIIFDVENLTDVNITIQADSVSINKRSINDIIMSDDVAPQSIGEVLARCDIDELMEVETVGGQLRIIDLGKSFPTYSATFINIPI